jgi:hypothetical protein
MVLEAFPLEIFLGELVPLDHGAHRAVEQEDALLQQRFELLADASGGMGGLYG